MNSQHKKHQSPRLEYFDYSNPGAYFITIVTKSSIPFFGKLHQGKSLLSKEGMIAEEIWKKIPDQFPFAAIDEWIIMPNHMHGIVVIKNKLNFIDSNSSNVFEKDTIYEKMKDNSGG